MWVTEMCILIVVAIFFFVLLGMHLEKNSDFGAVGGSGIAGIICLLAALAIATHDDGYPMSSWFREKGEIFEVVGTFPQTKTSPADTTTAAIVAKNTDGDVLMFWLYDDDRISTTTKKIVVNDRKQFESIQ